MSPSGPRALWGLGLWATAGLVGAVLLSRFAGGPGAQIELHGTVIGLPPGAVGTVVASRGDCLDLQRNPRVLAHGTVEPGGRFRLVALAPAGVGAVCVLAGPLGGITRLPAQREAPPALTVTLGPILRPGAR